MIKNIIILLLILLIIFNLFKPKKEHFTDTSFLEEKVNNYYANNIKYINNVLDYVNNYNINNNNINIKSTTPINCNNMTVGGLYASGYNKFNNLTINGNLTISDNLVIDDYRNDSYTKDINIIPRYTIIAWYDKYYVKNDTITPLNIPKGWVLCDGKSYYIQNNSILELNSEFSNLPDIIKTPNLVDKFVIGQSTSESEWFSNDLNQTFKNRIIPFNSYGGNNFHTITLNELPIHFHEFILNTKIDTLTTNIINKQLSLSNEEASIVAEVNNKYGTSGSISRTWQSDGSYKINILNNNTIINDPTIDVSKNIYLNGIMGGLWNIGGGEKVYTYTDEDGGSKEPESFDVRPSYINLYYIMKI